MSQSNRNLGALIGSRICHDLISPVGAISNGLELLSLSGAPEGPEMALISDSAAHANARIRFFRVAFGLASAQQSMSAREITGILKDAYTGAVTVDWQIEGSVPRPFAQAAFLALMCAEQAVPYGGAVSVSGAPEAVRLSATGPRLSPNAAHWAALSAPASDMSDLAAAQVQFALLPGLLTDMGRQPKVTLGEAEVVLAF